MNDTIGENELVPALFVFGVIPRFPIVSTQIPIQMERMKVLAAAQAEMNAIIVEKKITATLTKYIPPATNRVYKIGEEVLV